MPNDFDASEYIDLFLAESREHLDAISSALVTAEADPGDSDAVDAIFRAAHSFKGMSATMGFDQLAALTHALEGMIEVLRSSTTKLPSEAIDTMFATLDLLGEMVAQIERDGATDADPAQLIAALAAHAKQQKKRPTIAARASVRPARPKTPDSPDDFVAAAVRANQQQSTVRVEAERLDHLLHMMGELVIRRSRVEQLVADTGVSELQAAVDDLTRVSQSVQEIVMRVRMIPIDTAFARIPRLVRDISHQLGKSVDLQLTGSETELDRTAVDALIEPLMHLVRNAVDHGIEPASERLAVGKPANGKVTISARHDGGEVVITVVDDGNGIDSAAIAETAVARGLISASDAEQLSEDAALEFLFQPGFSTAKRISNISGRGVGMDAVRE
ncbi:MAG: Hpt domain-containing protein, partial [Thermoleophilaceae bacterium]|nr:Hpt domain-containing protein [Thermoleophilaceae bacterium]